MKEDDTEQFHGFPRSWIERCVWGGGVATFLCFQGLDTSCRPTTTAEHPPKLQYLLEMADRGTLAQFRSVWLELPSRWNREQWAFALWTERIHLVRSSAPGLGGEGASPADEGLHLALLDFVLKLLSLLGRSTECRVVGPCGMIWLDP